MIPVILSGGSGSRLWPLSRRLCPKQFLALHAENTLFQETVLRLQRLALEAPIVVCNADHRFAVANNIQEIDCTSQAIILEPVARNTAPAIAVAALNVMEKDADSIILVLPADHTIENEKALGQAFETAKKLAQQDFLVTFGVKPTSAHTGYGYIQCGEALEENANEIQSFVEKPDKATAEIFLKDGGYFWNSGMFCFKASRYLAELEQHHPEILEHAKQALSGAEVDYDFLRLNQEGFEKCTNISIDYAVMEKTNKGCVVGIDADWSDIGSWDAVWQASDRDDNNNVCKGDVIVRDSQNSFIHAEDKLLVALGIDNLMVVDTPDALLIAEKSKAQDVKHVVEQLKAEGRQEADTHRKVDRPWGHYDLLYASETSEIKYVRLKENAKLTLQKHEHRSEHWVVLSGKAKVTKGDEVLFLSRNESVYLPLGVNHALENVGDGALEIIEVRTGEYIDEQDIVRMDD